MKNRYDDIPAFVTKDGSLIRELMHPQSHGNRMQSFAEAIVGVGMGTASHRHLESEEIYHVTQGKGEMSLGEAIFEVHAGDTICIFPQTPHSIKNTGDIDLRIICASSPPYSHGDTELLKNS
ncbi:MAG: cupin domain-containing protein [Burkholderiales bacterium]|nr:cupin domain-containing protein [Burkholderiales bacterium]